MNEVQNNKKYIRDNIPAHQQDAFYDYFTKLPEQHLFQSWSLAKTIEVVQQFKRTCAPPSAPETGQGNINKPNTDDPSAKLTKQPNSSEQQLQTQIVTVTSNTQKIPNAISLLDQIQRNFNHTAQKNAGKGQYDWQKLEGINIWSTFQGSLRKQENKKIGQKDPFQNFDSFITSSPKKTAAEPDVTLESKSVTSSPKVEETYELKRSQQVKRVSFSELKRTKSDKKLSSSLKEQEQDKKGLAFDKIFKYKLADQFACRRLAEGEQLTGITVHNHEIVHRTLLPDYAIYHIKSYPRKILCKRTYDDFLQLRKILQKLYPGVKVPSIQSASWFSESDIALINTNKVSLQQFLNDILNHPTLSRTEVFKDFITVPDHAKIERVLQDYDRISTSSSFSQLANPDGIVKVILSEEQHRIVQQLPRWKKHFSNYFQRYIDLISNLISQYQSIKITFSQLTTLTSDFHSRIKQSQEYRMILNSPEELQAQLTKQYTYFTKKRSDIQREITNLKEKYLTILKYEKLNITSFEPMIEVVESLTERYIKRLQNQPESPSSDLQSFRIAGRTKKFQDDIWHESQNIALFKYQVGFFNCKLLQESQLFNRRLKESLQNAWNEVFEKREQPSARLSH